MGKNYVNRETFLEYRYNEDLELEDAIYIAILTLKKSFEGQMTEDNVEVSSTMKLDLGDSFQVKWRITWLS